MSLKYTRIAWDIPLRYNEKIVLVALADFCNDDGMCFPSLETLSKRCGLAKSCLIQHIKSLETRGILIRQKRRNQKGYSKSTQYVLKIKLVTGNQNADNLNSNHESRYNQIRDYENLNSDCDTSMVRNTDTNLSIEPSKEQSAIRKSKEGNPNIQIVFDHWRTVMNHPKAILDTKRKNVINSALKSYSLDDLKQAIDGCARSPYHMGQNDAKAKYDSLELILRDAEHIEKFVNIQPTGSGRSHSFNAPDSALMQGVI